MMIITIIIVIIINSGFAGPPGRDGGKGTQNFPDIIYLTHLQITNEYISQANQAFKEKPDDQVYRASQGSKEILELKVALVHKAYPDFQDNQVI
jgi:hypothetical protein